MGKETLAPFNDPNADLIIRSSDDFDFRVYKSLMQMSIPMFRSFPDLPQPADEETTNSQGRHPTAIVQIAEPSSVLDILLRFCYPIPIIGSLPSFQKPLDIIFVMDAARRLEIKGLDELAKQALLVPHFATDLEVFIVSCRFGWTDAAKLAKARYLEHGLVNDESPILQYAKANDVMEMINHFKTCGDALRELGDGFDWLSRLLSEEDDDVPESPYSPFVLWLDSHFKLKTSRSRIKLPRPELAAYIIEYSIKDYPDEPDPPLTKTMPPIWLVNEARHLGRALAERPSCKTVRDALPRMLAAGCLAAEEERWNLEIACSFVVLLADGIEAAMLRV